MFRHILVPVDAATNITAAVSSVSQWLGGTGATVRLLRVEHPVREIERRADRIVPLDELMREAYAHWQDYLRRLGSHLAYNGIVVHREVRFGNVLDETLVAARRYAVEAIVVAGQEAPRREFLRTNWIHQLLAQAVVPVLVVPANSPAKPRPGLQYRGVPASPGN
jgi:nucleotide-binding universal stress UspA family protein